MKIGAELLSFVKRYCLIANTPAFLFESIRDSEAVLLLANSLKSSEIIDRLHQIAENPERTPDQLATVYLLLACLSFKTDYELSRLSHAKFEWVDWYDRFLSLLSMNSNTVNSIVIEPDYVPPEIGFLKVSDSAPNYESFNLNNLETEESKNAI